MTIEEKEQAYNYQHLGTEISNILLGWENNAITITNAVDKIIKLLQEFNKKAKEEKK